MGIFQYGRFLFDKKLTVCNLIDKAAALYGSRPLLYFAPALHYAGVRQGMSAAQARDFMNRVSNVLTEHAGLQRYDRVAIYKENAADYFLFGLAAIRAGGISVPINGGMGRAELLQYLQYTGAAVLITDRSRYEQMRDDLATLPGLQRVLLTDAAAPATALDLTRLIATASERFEAVEPAADEDVLLVHTSGTTGFPKGVIHTSGSLVAGVKGQLRFRHYFSDGDVAVNAAPANHFVYFLGMLSAIASNSRVWLAGDTSARHVLGLIARERLSIVFSFPHTFLSMQELGLHNFRLDSVRMWMSAADSSHEAHIREFTRHGALLRLFGRKLLGSMYVDSMGSSEVGFGAINRFSFSFSRKFNRYIGRSSSVGPRVKIADEQGRRLKAGQIGYFMVKGPTLFKGYWNAHDKLHGVVRDGWWRTGDIGFANGNNGYYHLDRATDVISTPNGDVHSLLVEEHVLKFPGVLEAVVLARDAGNGYHEPFAVVQLAASAPGIASEILDWANSRLSEKDRLAGLTIVGREGIPRGLTGKVLKRAMRASAMGASAMGASAMGASALGASYSTTLGMKP